MRSRLEALGVTGVEARTFHSAAYAQLRAFAAEPPGAVLPSKALMLRHIGNRLPRPYRFRPAGDLATEIEWAKNRRLTPSTYRQGLDGHEPPIPVDLMERVFGEYEQRKDGARQGGLRGSPRGCDPPPRRPARPRRAVHERYRAFTVDEYQDVNLLQQTLLERWLGGRDDLCVVGDDYQSIYSFVGATPAHLLAAPERFPDAAVIRLEENYRSTPGGSRAREQARAQARRRREDAAHDAGRQGPSPSSGQSTGAEEHAFVVGRIRALHAEERSGLPRAGDPLPDERALGRMGGGACGRGDSVRRARRRLPRASGRAPAARCGARLVVDPASPRRSASSPSATGSSSGLPSGSGSRRPCARRTSVAWSSSRGSSTTAS